MPSFRHTFIKIEHGKDHKINLSKRPNQYHTDYIIYHNAMALEFSDKRNFSLPLTTRHSIMDASTKSKAQGRQGNPEAEGRVGEMMFLNRTGEHMCALLFKT